MAHEVFGIPSHCAVSRLRRLVAGLVAVSALAAVLVPSRVAAQEETAQAQLVPEPSGGVSSWTRVVPPNGARVVSSEASSSRSVAIGGDPTRLQVKFSEESKVEWLQSGLDDGEDDSQLDRLLAAAAVDVQPLFGRDAAQLREERAEAEAVSGEPQPDLTKWFVVTAGGQAAGAALATRLRELPEVEMVQPEPDLAPTQAPEEDLQGYLDPSPKGVNAEWVWQRRGGTGDNVRIVVIDSGFDTNHADLDRASAPGVSIPHEPAWDSRHGLQVLGILVADDDGQGMRGLAHGSAVNTINSGRSGSDIANAIDLAATVAGPGDIVTVSQGVCAVSGCADGVVLPLVYSSSARDALKVASARGLVTVVSAGNGGANLNSYASRLGSDAPDTIVVGAGNGASTGGCTLADGPPRSRVATSNYGSRVDLQGWGSCVRTLRQGGGYQWWGFTSAATPVVSGAAALLSSIAEQRRGIQLTGSQIRALLRATGSGQSFAGTRGGSIGPLPNVRAAVGSLSELPSNDLFDRAQSLSSFPLERAQDTRFAGVETDEPSLRCAAASNSVWYSIRVPSDTQLTISTRGSDYDTAIGLWRQDADGLRRAGCNDDVTVNNPDSELTRTLSSSTTYYLQVASTTGEGGELELSVVPAGFSGVGCDIDGDGFGDLVSGTPWEGVSGARQAGRALVHFGRADGSPQRVSSVTQEWPGLPGVSQRGDRFGAAIACGDFNGDGFDDLAVGSPGEGTRLKPRSGSVRIIPGTPSGLATTGAISLKQSSVGVKGKAERGDRFGSALAVGDFDGDGFDDLAVAAAQEDRLGVANVGAVSVLYGRPSGLRGGGSQLFAEGSGGVPGPSRAADRFGDELAAGDFDNDGFDDLAIGIPKQDIGGAINAGAAVVLSGSASGVSAIGAVRLHQSLDTVASSSQSGDSFAEALSVGDVNGDLFDDLAIGVPGDRVAGLIGAGRTHLFEGGSDGISASRSSAIHQDTSGIGDQAETGDRFGASVQIADLSGDGFDELSVGAPGESIGGTETAGQLHVINGGPGGLQNDTDQLVSQALDIVVGRSATADRLGHALAAVDIDGDGRRDVAAGIPGKNVDGKADAGAILVVPGDNSGVRRGAAILLTQKSPQAGLNEPGDRMGDVLGS